MVMGSIPQEVDLAIIGGGVGGYTAAIRAAELGMSVAIVEKGKMGGHCPNYACIPSKTMIHVSDLFYKMKNSEKFGIHADNITIDAKKLYDWRVAVSKKLENGVEFLCKENGIDILKAEGTFLSSNTIQLSDGVTLEFKKAIIATGSAPRAVKGFDFGGKVMDYKAVLLLDYIPKSIVIIGAGYVSVEIATLFAKLGSKVTVIARSDILSTFDRDAVALIKQRMGILGIDVRTGVTPLSQSTAGIKLSDNSEVVADIIVVAIGLDPYVAGLGLERTKVELDEGGFVKVDSALRTTDPNIYAVGDVSGGPLLAHKAIRQGVVAAESISTGKSFYDNKAVPAVIFSDPEVAIAGSIEQGEGVEVIKFPLSAIGRAVALDETLGFAKIAYEKDTGLIKGIEIVSQDANALISEATLAIEMGATLEDIADTIHPHPTYSEVIAEAAEAALGRPIHFFYGKTTKQVKPE
jgi:dihydrolipoamide dehydrogenase